MVLLPDWPIHTDQTFALLLTTACLFFELLSNSKHGGEENAVVAHPVHVGVPGHRGAVEGAEVVVRVNHAVESVPPVTLPAILQ